MSEAFRNFKLKGVKKSTRRNLSLSASVEDMSRNNVYYTESLKPKNKNFIYRDFRINATKEHTLTTPLGKNLDGSSFSLKLGGCSSNILVISGDTGYHNNFYKVLVQSLLDFYSNYSLDIVCSFAEDFYDFKDYGNVSLTTDVRKYFSSLVNSKKFGRNKVIIISEIEDYLKCPEDRNAFLEYVHTLKERGMILVYIGKDKTNLLSEISSTHATCGIDDISMLNLYGRKIKNIKNGDFIISDEDSINIVSIPLWGEN